MSQMLKVIRCSTIHKNDCDCIITGKLIRDVEKNIMIHEKEAHPERYYKMSERDRIEFNESIHTFLSMI